MLLVLLVFFFSPFSRLSSSQGQTTRNDQKIPKNQFFTRQGTYISYILERTVLTADQKIRVNISIGPFSQAVNITLKLVTTQETLLIFEKGVPLSYRHENDEYVCVIREHEPFIPSLVLEYQFELKGKALEGVKTFLISSTIHLTTDTEIHESLPLDVLVVQSDLNYSKETIVKGNISRYCKVIFDDTHVTNTRNTTFSLEFVNPDETLHSYQIEILDYTNELLFFYAGFPLASQRTVSKTTFYFPSDPITVNLRLQAPLHLQLNKSSILRWAQIQVEFRLIVDETEVGSYIQIIELQSSSLNLTTVHALTGSFSLEGSTCKVQLSMNSTSFNFPENITYIHFFLPEMSNQIFELHGKVLVEKNGVKLIFSLSVPLSGEALAQLRSSHELRGELIVITGKFKFGFTNFRLVYTSTSSSLSSSESLFARFWNFYTTQKWWQWILICIAEIGGGLAFLVLFWICDEYFTKSYEQAEKKGGEGTTKRWIERVLSDLFEYWVLGVILGLLLTPWIIFFIWG